MQIQIHEYTLTYKCAQGRMITHAHTYVHTHAYIYIHTYIYTYTRMHPHTQRAAHTCTHTHARTHARTHTHTHAHTHMDKVQIKLNLTFVRMQYWNHLRDLSINSQVAIKQ